MVPITEGYMKFVEDILMLFCISILHFLEVVLVKSYTSQEEIKDIT